jgi:hypothetical protein
VAPAGRDGVRGVCHRATAVSPLSRARRRGIDAVLGKRSRLASGAGPRWKPGSARRHVRSPQFASRPSHGQAARVAREVEHASELALGDRERAQGNVKLVGDLLSGERSLRAEAAVDASQRDDGAGRSCLRPTVTDDTKASGVGENLPRGLGVGLSEAAGAVRGGLRRGALAGRAMVPQRRWSAAHRLDYGRPPEAPATPCVRIWSS